MLVEAQRIVPAGRMEVEEFLEFLATRPDEEKWELVEGHAIMMAPPAYAHQRIADNFKNLLNAAFVEKGLDYYALQETGIRNPALGNFMPRPDVTVIPGVAGYEIYRHDYRLVAEVLSPSNNRRLVGLKLNQYRQAADCLYAVVIESRRIALEIHARSRDWQPLSLEGSESPIEMPEFGLACRAFELYRGTPLDITRN